MNVFNRIIMVLGILAALVVVTYLMVDPYGAVMILRNGLDAFDRLLYTDQFYTFFLLGLGGTVLLLLILLWLELRRAHYKTARIKTQHGAAELGVQSVAQSLEYRIDELAGVRKVRTHVVSHGRDVGIRVDLDTSPSVNIPVLTEQIANLCQDIVEGQLGVRIHGKVQINVKHEPYPKGTMPPTAPLGVEPVTQPPRMRPEAELPKRPAPAPEPARRERVAPPAPQPVQPLTEPQRIEAPEPFASILRPREPRPEPVEVEVPWGAEEEPEEVGEAPTVAEPEEFREPEELGEAVEAVAEEAVEELAGPEEGEPEEAAPSEEKGEEEDAEPPTW